MSACARTGGFTVIVFIAKYAVVILIGAAIGSGTFTVFDWRWWAWDLAILASITARDWAMEQAS